ncbi:MAG: hypothetical protein B6U72_01185 [Candidatus Altiarchaeales archaeon ex4484_2]|nr:MAG: hypothetical protein B6U72_01185 [Candidatus Altiarchaeales archaeon ex4484_2]
MSLIDFVVPVIDIKDGVAVGAKQGRREIYRELSSMLVDSSNPLQVSMAYKQLGFKSIYVADLDGIMNKSPNLDLLKGIRLGTGLDVMADIGTWSGEAIFSIEAVGIIPILATETFTSLNLLRFPKKFALGLDIRNGSLLCEMNCDLDVFLDLIRDSPTIVKVIAIDLDRVGMSSGPNLDLCEMIVDRLDGVELIYGGGVRFLLDVAVLLDAGVSRVLIGSSLHEGRITVEELIEG